MPSDPKIPILIGDYVVHQSPKGDWDVSIVRDLRSKGVMIQRCYDSFEHVVAKDSIVKIPLPIPPDSEVLAYENMISVFYGKVIYLDFVRCFYEIQVGNEVKQFHPLFVRRLK